MTPETTAKLDRLADAVFDARAVLAAAIDDYDSAFNAAMAEKVASSRFAE